MNSDKSREVQAAGPQALMEAAEVFLFLSEVFKALDSGGVDMTLTSGSAGGLSSICNTQAGKLLDAYGRS